MKYAISAVVVVAAVCPAVVAGVTVKCLVLCSINKVLMSAISSAVIGSCTALIIRKH